MDGGGDDERGLGEECMRGYVKLEDLRCGTKSRLVDALHLSFWIASCIHAVNGYHVIL
jgi:hypothetical protein